MLPRAGVGAAEARTQEASRNIPVQQLDWGGAAQAWSCWTEHVWAWRAWWGSPPRKLEVSLMVSGKDYEPGWARDITNVTSETQELKEMQRVSWGFFWARDTDVYLG